MLVERLRWNTLRKLGHPACPQREVRGGNSFPAGAHAGIDGHLQYGLDNLRARESSAARIWNLNYPGAALIAVSGGDQYRVRAHFRRQARDHVRGSEPEHDLGEVVRHRAERDVPALGRSDLQSVEPGQAALSQQAERSAGALIHRHPASPPRQGVIATLSTPSRWLPKRS